MSQKANQVKAKSMPRDWRKAVMASKEIKQSDKIVLLFLAENCDPSRDGEAWPSIKLISKETGRAHSCAKKSIANLKKAGLLEILTGAARTRPLSKRSNHYKLPALERLLMGSNSGPLNQAKWSDLSDHLNQSKSSESAAPSLLTFKGGSRDQTFEVSAKNERMPNPDDEDAENAQPNSVLLARPASGPDGGQLELF